MYVCTCLRVAWLVIGSLSCRQAEQSKKPLEFEAATEAINGMQGRADAHVRQSRPRPATDKPKNAGSLGQFAMLEADSLVQSTCPAMMIAVPVEQGAFAS